MQMEDEILETNYANGREIDLEILEREIPEAGVPDGIKMEML
jgi:hypothetical protein